MRLTIHIDVPDELVPRSTHKARSFLKRIEVVGADTTEFDHEYVCHVYAKLRDPYTRCPECLRVFSVRKDGQPVRHRCLGE